MPFQIIRNDITKVKADAIVNTANPQPTYGDGTDQAIYMAAGIKQLLHARARVGEIAPGQAAETSAFLLKAKYIIHTVGPVWQGGDQGESEILRSCYANALSLAEKLGCKSIAFPLIAAGNYGFPKDLALQTAMSVIQPYVMEHSMRVILVVFDKTSFELSGRVVETVREYVDANYVEEASRREKSSVEANTYAGSRRAASRPAVGNRVADKLAFPRPAKLSDAEDECAATYPAAEPMMSAEPIPVEEKMVAYSSSAVEMDLSELVIHPEKTFQERLFEIIDARGLSGPQVYKNYISKQVYSKIQGDRNYHPNKYTAIALCLSLHLDVEESEDLLRRAGWAFNPSSKADLVVKACIQNGEYNVVRINILLFDFDCPELEKIR